MPDVKAHTRKGRKVRKHKRNAAWVKLHPRYKMWGDRPHSGMEMSTLMNKKKKYEDELHKIRTGYYDGGVQAGHEAFIVRRLKAAYSAIKKKS
jgi:hypothetical protein